MYPLISIITPFYNAYDTLAYALSSIMYQTYQNWECILVDDGSVDDSQSIIKNFQDSRFKSYRLDLNQGRGAARQYALNRAKGEYLCMLDADDWLYPQKLETQLKIMQTNPNLSLLSSGLAVVNQQDEILGVREIIPAPSKLRVFQSMTYPSPPKVNFASSMIRMQIARNAQFDLSLRRSEDADFLLQILLKNPYGFLNEIQYVYRELIYIDKKEVLSGYNSRIKVYRKYRVGFPLMSRKEILITWIKWFVHRVGFNMDLGLKLFRRRDRKPTEEEIDTYKKNLKLLQVGNKEV